MRKAVCQAPSEASVVGAVGTNNVRYMQFLTYRILSVLWLSSLAVTTYVIHSIRVAERQEVGSNADNGTILEMKIQNIAVALTTYKEAGVWKARNGRQLGAGKLAQGMKVEIVYAKPDKVAKTLQDSTNILTWMVKSPSQILTYKHYNSEWKSQAELDWDDGFCSIVADENAHRGKISNLLTRLHQMCFQLLKEAMRRGEERL